MSEKEIIEDITAEVVASGVAEPLSADKALKTSAKDLRSSAEGAHKKALYKAAQARGQGPKREEAAAGELSTKLISINRITKVVKGGRTLRFNALVIVGDKNGRVGIGSGKAREVTEAIKKAEQDGKKNLKNVAVVGTTIPHEVFGRFGTCEVKLMPARAGFGLVAGGPVRAVLELGGYKDVSAKCYGSTNSTNVVKAVMDGLRKMRTAEEVAALRGK